MSRKRSTARTGRQHQLRIIGGRWRSRKLSFAEVPGVRPTPDRVRETVFNWLQPSLAGARCLDLFAGSGALGFEALSRGAAEVVMVDRDRRVVETLRQQAQTLKAENLLALQSEVMAFLAGSTATTQRSRLGPFDVVFLDPPYGLGLLAACCDALESGGWLSTDARIYLEAEATLGIPNVPRNWQVTRSKSAGQVGYHLAVRQAT
jgi:16S rRNA (guanine966-N2)-methyltransferase